MPDRFDKFTERARKVLQYSQEEAQHLNHNYIGTEHLLLGLIREREGVAARVLANLGVDMDHVRAAVDFLFGHADRTVTGDIGLTPRARKVIELSVDEARRLNHHYIGTEHLLLGLVREGEGMAAGVLESLGVSLDTVPGQVVAMLEQWASSGLPPLPAEPRPPGVPAALERPAERAGPPGHERFGRFTEGASSALQLAQEEAARHGHASIGPEHLLIGLVAEREGLAAHALRAAGVDLERARAAFERVVADVPQPGEMVGLTRPAKRVIELMIAEARRLGHRDIGTEHLLLGLLAQPETRAISMLEDLGAPPEKVRTALEALMPGGPGGG